MCERFYIKSKNKEKVNKKKKVQCLSYNSDPDRKHNYLAYPFEY